MKNEFKALFEILAAEEMEPSLNEQFTIFRMKQKIEKIIYEKYEFNNNQIKRLDIAVIYDYEIKFLKFTEMIVQSTVLC